MRRRSVQAANSRPHYSSNARWRKCSYGCNLKTLSIRSRSGTTAFCTNLEWLQTSFARHTFTGGTNLSTALSKMYSAITRSGEFHGRSKLFVPNSCDLFTLNRLAQITSNFVNHNDQVPHFHVALVYHDEFFHTRYRTSPHAHKFTDHKDMPMLEYHADHSFWMGGNFDVDKEGCRKLVTLSCRSHEWLTGVRNGSQGKDFEIPSIFDLTGSAVIVIWHIYSHQFGRSEATAYLVLNIILDADDKHISTESLSHVAAALNLSVSGDRNLRFRLRSQKLSHLRVFTFDAMRDAFLHTCIQSPLTIQIGISITNFDVPSTTISGANNEQGKSKIKNPDPLGIIVTATLKAVD
ncbi:hypothetical protein C8R45DRAFT_922746 [Mycena sanguinolenta]|nr:hypothetical protein C8R45DRAFT_922746 [Mycena sanguinolenta]